MACYGCPGRWKGLPGAADQLQRAGELLLGEQHVGLYRPELSEMRSRILDALSANPRFRADTRAAVVLLLNRTLTFLRDRYDRGGPLLPYGTDIMASERRRCQRVSSRTAESRLIARNSAINAPDQYCTSGIDGRRRGHRARTPRLAYRPHRNSGIGRTPSLPFPPGGRFGAGPLCPGFLAWFTAGSPRDGQAAWSVCWPVHGARGSRASRGPSAVGGRTAEC
jgi:hypothetical protein